MTRQQAHYVWNAINYMQQVGQHNIAQLMAQTKQRVGEDEVSELPADTWMEETLDEYRELQEIKADIQLQLWRNENNN